MTQKGQRPVLPMIFPVLLLTLVIATMILGYRHYLGHKNQIIYDKYNELAAVADLKVDQIVNWRGERLAEDLLLLKNPFFAEAVERFLSNPESSLHRTGLATWLSPVRENDSFHSIVIFDTNLAERVTFGIKNKPAGKLTRSLAAGVLRSGTTAISDFHVGDAIARIHLDVLIPLSVRRDGGSALIGVILVRVDPSHELHPIIQSWPTPSPTAETLLVRREGSDVIYLNELRHRKDSALSNRMPLTRKEVPAVQAVLGHTGNFQGKDYRDVQVLSVTRKIPGTPWYLVAKVDSAEIIAPVRREAWTTGAFSVLLILLAGAGVGLIWRHSSAKFYKRLYQEVHAKSLLADHVERLNRMYLTLNSANQAIVRCRDRQTLFEELCRIVVENGGFRMAWIGLVNRESRVIRPLAFSGYDDGYLENITISADAVPAGRGPAGRAVREGRYVVCQNIDSDLSMEPWRKEAVTRGYRSLACFPLVKASESIGVLCAYSSETNFFDGEIVALLNELGADISFALSSMEQTEALLASEIKYRLLFDNMINGFAMHEIIYDERDIPVDYRILDVNLAFVELTGISRERAIGALASQIYGMDKAPYLEIYADVAEKGSNAVFDTYFQPYDKYFSISVFSPGKGKFATVFTDSTDRTKAETLTRLNESRLQSLYNISQYRAANVQELLDFALVEALRLTSSKVGYIYFYDEIKKEFTLNSWSDEVMKECTVLAQQTTYSLEKTGIWGEAVRQRRPITVNDFQVSNPLKKGFPPGHVELFSYLTVPVFLGEKIVAVLGVANKEGVYDDTDVRQLALLGDSVWKYVERKKIEEELIHLNLELETRVLERTAELEAFTYSVSHDLRAPLRAIRGFSGILLDEYSGSLNTEGRRLLDVIIGNTTRMGKLIDDLLSFSRVGRLELNHCSIDMTALAQSVCEEILTEGPRKRIRCQVETLPEARGDVSLLRQVWVNLLSNAVKFTLPKDQGTIAVGALPGNEENVYFVRDTGVGFDMQHVNKLFAIFQRLHSSDEFEGTGVGLAIVQRIVERHHGRVWAEGRQGEGASFYFSLPRKGFES